MNDGFLRRHNVGGETLAVSIVVAWYGALVSIAVW